MRTRLLAIPLVLIAMNARADIFGCSETAQRRASAPLAGVTHLTVIGRAGELRVIGRRGVREVLATGTACADTKSELNDIQFRVEQRGSDLRVEALIPEHISSWFGSNGRLDMEVTVPDTMPIDIEDGSGEATIENVGPLKMTDGSGELTIRHVHGSATVHDGSGELVIEDVAGDLRVNDGSGEIDITHVAGNVTIDDGSGGIDIRDVQRNVVIDNDGSGGIDVRDVRGDFTVDSKGSGTIEYDRVSGRVSIPERHRHRD